MMIAIIPARSGSTGLPHKNVLPLCGKPMIVWSIQAALDSDCFDRVIVSTDSPRYGSIAEEAGAEVMLRGTALSDSSATTFMVLYDLLNRLQERPDCFALLQPTSPLRSADQVKEAVSLFLSESNEFDFLASVRMSRHSSDLVKPLDCRGGLGAFNADFSAYRRQASAPEYSPNGAIFIAKTEEYLKQGHFFGGKSIAYVMDKESSIDIDDILDFRFAEVCMTRRLHGEGD